LIVKRDDIGEGIDGIGEDVDGLASAAWQEPSLSSLTKLR
jgi:hypothetical protein